MMRLLLLAVAGVLLGALVLWMRSDVIRVSRSSVFVPARSADAIASLKSSGASDSATPQRPRATVETTPVPSPGQVLVVPAGGHLQNALGRARPGDIIELLAGASYVGNFILPNKAGSGWITIRSSDHARLPQPGVRVSPAQSTLMPKIVSPNPQPAIRTAQAAHHFRFVGIEITTTSAVNVNLIWLESPRQTAAEHVPTDIIFDRCYIHGNPAGDIRRGIALNGARLAVIDSYVSDFHERGADSQAVVAWNGPGPFKIVNNYLEAAGENVMFGGADPTIPELVPSDIEIRRNHFFKPPSWRIGHPEYAGKSWTVKNLFELKNSRRVLIEGNVFEHNWAHAQAGFAILFTVRNQDGRAPWSIVEDVTFVNNIVRRTTSGINITGGDNNNPSEPTRRIVIRNNLFQDVTEGSSEGGGGRLFQLLSGTTHVIIEHNTAFHTGPIIMTEGQPHVGFVFRHNIVPHNTYGIFGSGAGIGTPTLEKYFSGAIVTGNVIIGGSASRYPPGNHFPTSIDEVGFTNRLSGDYRLRGSSRYKHIAAGKDPGVDLDALRSAVGTIPAPHQPSRN